MNICILLHTHSDYSDLWDIIFKRFKIYGPNYDLYVLSNKIIEQYDTTKTIVYKSHIPFAERILNASTTLDYEYILLMRDSDILVGPTDVIKLSYLEETIKKYDIDSLRLNNSGVNDNDLHNIIENDCYYINENSDYLFSLYPTIWKKRSLLDLMKNFKTYKYYDMECKEINNFCKKYKNCFVYNEACKIRQYNERYAHIIKFIHILQHGKWTYVHDPSYVLEIKKEFNIDLTKRGFHNSSYRRLSQTNDWYPSHLNN